MRYNQTAIAGLPAATKGWAEAHLIEYSTDPKSEKRVWTFFLNPQTLKFSGDAKYSETNTFAAREQDVQFGSSSGLTLELPNLYLDSYCLGRSLKPLLDGIDELRKADAKRSKFNPTVLSFIWGTRRFSPCVLTRVSWDESAWLNGEPARAEMSLSFLQIPKPGDQGIANLPEALKASQDGNAKQAENKPRQDLTDRQKQDASTQAKTWLTANTQTLSPQVQNAIRTKSYKLATDATTGDVAMTDAKGNKFGVVGRWDGKKFTTDTINTLPKK